MPFKKTESQDKSIKRLYFNHFHLEAPENAVNLRTHLEVLSNVEVPQSLLDGFEIETESLGFAYPKRRKHTRLSQKQYNFLKANFEKGRLDKKMKVDEDITHRQMRNHFIDGKKLNLIFLEYCYNSLICHFDYNYRKESIFCLRILR